jgi:hypothetical protein
MFHLASIPLWPECRIIITEGRRRRTYRGLKLQRTRFRGPQGTHRDCDDPKQRDNPIYVPRAASLAISITTAWSLLLITLMVRRLGTTYRAPHEVALAEMTCIFLAAIRHAKDFMLIGTLESLGASGILLAVHYEVLILGRGSLTSKNATMQEREMLESPLGGEKEASCISFGR